MDQKLLAWARAVKARRPQAGPVLWLFTDATRLPNPLPTIARLPKGICGVVLRHDELENRAALARTIAQLCRQRRLALTVAGDWRLARSIGAGLHIRPHDHGLAARPIHPRNTASAHSARDLRRARHIGALAFLSPIYLTHSHPGAPAMGPLRWTGLARAGAGALGGVSGNNVGRLGRGAVRAVGAVSALK